MLRTGLGIVFILIFSGCARILDSFTVRETPVPTLQGGVVFHDRFRAQNGFRIALSYEGRGCDVIDREGQRRARFPGGYCLFLPDDQYFAVLDRPTLFDRDFSVLWSLPDVHQHHDAAYDADRDWIWLLTDNDLNLNRKKDFIHDTILAIERKTGKVVFTWSALAERKKLEATLGHAMTSGYSEVLQARVWSHLNSIQIVRKGQRGIAAPGDLVIGETRHGLVFILRPSTREIVWSHVIGMDIGHHSGIYLDSGEILMFINNVPERYSYLAKITPGHADFTWKQTVTPKENLFCDHFGYVEPLPNGNALVSHVRDGRGAAFEITPHGRIIWEWYNDELDGEGKPLETYRLTYQPEHLIQPYIERWEKRGAQLGQDLEPRILASATLDASIRYPSRKVLIEKKSLTPDAARKLIAERELVLNSLFQDYPSPYPGAISTRTQCAPHFRPHRVTEENERGVRTVYELFANERLAYGTCTETEIKSRSLYALVYCAEAQRFYELKLFLPLSEKTPTAEDFLRDLNCLPNRTKFQ